MKAIAKIGISLSLVFLTFAFILAHQNPATAYEPSIYSGTPVYYWVFLFISILVAMSLVVTGIRPLAGMALISTALLTIVGLPLLRRYWLIGGGDPMSHLSRLRRVSNGMDPLSIFYPGMPSLSEIIREILGIPSRIVLMALGPIFFIVFVVFMSLITRRLTLDHRGLATGAIVGLMMLPINLVATHLYPHPNSFTILFASVGFFLAITVLRSPSRSNLTPLFIFVAAMVAYHPQHALNIIAVLAVLGVVWQIFDDSSKIIVFNPLVSASAAMGVIWATWVLAQTRFKHAFVGVVMGILSADQADLTAGRGDTLTQLGSGIIDLAIRMFLVDLIALIFGTVSAIFALAWAARQAGLKNPLLKVIPFDRVSSDHRAVFCVVCSVIPVSVFFGVFLISGVTQQFMRFFGFGMFLASIIVAVGLTQTLELAPRWTRSTAIAGVLTVALTASLFGAGLTYHTSPMNFRDTGHVTEATVNGFDNQFEYHQDAEMMGAQVPVWRYAVVLEYKENNPMVKYTGGFRENPPPDHFANRSLHDRYADDRVLITTEKGRWLNTVLYDGIRYSSGDFAYLDRQPGINRMYDNGDVRAHFIHSNSTS